MNAQSQAGSAGIRLEHVAGCPRFAGYSPVEPGHVADPFPFFERARREASVFYLPDHQMWVVTRHEEILAVLRDTATY